MKQELYSCRTLHRFIVSTPTVNATQMQCVSLALLLNLVISGREHQPDPGGHSKLDNNDGDTIANIH